MWHRGIFAVTDTCGTDLCTRNLAGTRVGCTKEPHICQHVVNVTPMHLNNIATDQFMAVKKAFQIRS